MHREKVRGMWEVDKKQRQVHCQRHLCPQRSKERAIALKYLVQREFEVDDKGIQTQQDENNMTIQSQAEENTTNKTIEA